MLLKLTGSSCAGKSTMARAAALPESVVVHDFDEVGVPERPGTCWRQENNEWWVRRALDYQREGRHLLLAGQSPIGEVLAATSAVELDGIAVCLIDVRDKLRVERLRRRHSERSTPEGELRYLRWAEWHRRHAEDPRSEQGVIVRPECRHTDWARWTEWSKGDPRWQVDVIDTSDISVEAAAGLLVGWVERQLERLEKGTLALGPGWFD